MRLVQTTLGIPVYFDETAKATARATGLWPRKRIILGPMWAKLPEPERTAVLYHEIGHCKALHMEGRALVTCAAFAPAVFLLPGKLLVVILVTLVLWELAAWLARKSEYDADRFAAQHGHGPALARYLCRPIAYDGATDFYPSRSDRIDALATQQEAPCSSD